MWNDGDDCPRSLLLQALEQPSEITVASTDGSNGVSVLVGADVNSVECVGVSSLADLLWVGHG